MNVSSKNFEYEFCKASLSKLDLEIIFVDQNSDVFFPTGTFLDIKRASDSFDKFIIKYFPSNIHKSIINIFEICKAHNFTKNQEILGINIFKTLKQTVISLNNKKFFLDFKVFDGEGVFIYFIPINIIRKDYLNFNIAPCVIIDSKGYIKFTSSKLQKFTSLTEGLKLSSCLEKFNNNHYLMQNDNSDNENNISKIIDGKILHNNSNWTEFKDDNIYIFNINKERKLMKIKTEFITLNKQGQMQIMDKTDDNVLMHEMIIIFDEYQNYQTNEIITESREILDIISASYVILDKYGKVKWHNKYFLETIANNDNFIHGKYVTKWIKPGGYIKISNILQDKKESFYMYSLDHTKTYKANVNQFLLKTNNNDINYLISIHDVTDFIKKESKILKCQEMQAIGNITAKVSHDFNNLLTVVNSFCEVLSLQKQDKELTILIKDSIKRASALVKQILSFAKNGNTKTPIKVNLQNMISNLYSLLDKITGPKVILNLDTNITEGNVFFDTGELEQIIINLVVNARDAIENKTGTIDICIKEFEVDKDMIFCNRFIPYGFYKAISIKDTGSGISKAIVDEIFSPFFSTKKDKGTGLGLSTVLEIAQRNNSYILLNTEINKGSEFVILIPPYRGQISEILTSDVFDEVNTTKIEANKKSTNIILVDDDNAIRMLVPKALRMNNYQVQDFASGLIALKYIENNKVDIIISDVEMAEIDGPEFAKKAMEINPNVKVIFISGYRKESIDIEIRQNTFFLSKPFDSEDLINLLNKVISNNAEKDSNR